MNIIETKIPDIEIEKVDKNKVNLANKIIQFITPLLDQVYNEKINNYRIIKKEYQKKKQETSIEKTNLESLVKDFEMKKKAKKLLENFTKLFSLGVITLHTKNEIINILNSIDEITTDKLDFYIRESDKIIIRRLNKPISQ
jgi:hypothetical protein